MRTRHAAPGTLHAWARLAPSSALLVCLASACAATPPPPPAVVAPPPPPPPPPPDLSPVPSPANLVFSGRAANPAALASVAAGWARLPSLDPRALVEAMNSSMTSTPRSASIELAAVIDPAQPVDIAAAFEAKLPPSVVGAFAAAVTNIDEAKAALSKTYTLRPEDGGVVRLAPRTAGPDSDDAGACELAPAAGAAPFRLVCGSNHAALTALGPYLTRTTPRQAPVSDLHFELHTAPIAGFASLGRDVASRLLAARLGLDPAKEPARAELITAALGDLFDFIGDADVVSLDATADAEHAGLLYKTSFRGTTSWLAKVVTSHVERVAAPPAALWRLPGDVLAASFGTGIDDSDLARPRELLVAALDEELVKDKVAPADRTALTGLVKECVRGTPGLLGRGVAKGAPYWVVEWEEPAKGIEQIARDIAAVRLRPGVTRWAQADANKKAALPGMTIGAPLAWLPRGSLHAVVTVPRLAAEPPVKEKPHGKAGPPPVDAYHVAIMPDGPRAWVALSTSEAALRVALGSVAAPTVPPDALGATATRRGLDAFKDGRMTAGGFFTVRALAMLARGARSEQGADTDPRWDAVLDQLPAKGLTPVVLASSPLAPTGGDAGGSREVRVTIPADAIRDAVSFALQADSLKAPGPP